jgi:hypothetical protein
MHASWDNALLRRADWRFLLPTSSPRTAVCFTAGSLASSVAAVTETFQPDDARSEPADLAVVSDPADADLEEAYRVVRAGGGIYGEFRGFVAGQPGIVRRRLLKAGFEDVECYWPWPGPDKAPPQLWLPLDAPGALAYFRASRPPARSFQQRVLGNARMLLWRIGHAGRILRPVCAVARRPPDGGQTGGVLSVVRAHCEGAHSRLSWLVATPGRSPFNKVIGFVFEGDERAPSLIVKLPRIPESAERLEREAENLRALHRRREGGVTGAPRCVLFERDGWTVLGENPLTGRPFQDTLTDRSFPRLAREVTDWLVELAAEGRHPQADDWRSRLVEAPLASLARSPDARDVVTHMPRVRALLDRLDHLPSVPEQRDLGPWNLLVGNDGRLLVLDWESAEPNGLPLLDLVYFLTYASFFLDDALRSGRVVDSYARSLDPVTSTGRVVAACERRYVERLGLDPALISPLRALAWIIHSASESPRRALNPERAGGAAHAPVFLRLLVAELDRACSWWTAPAPGR